MPFRYLTDPLFVFCLALYAANRWVLKPYFPNEFSQSYLNDLICLPFWIPIMLWTMKCLGLRRTHTPPSGGELIVPLLVWSWLFEVYLPGLDSFKELTFADPADILCYTTGALLAAVFWKWWYHERRRTT